MEKIVGTKNIKSNTYAKILVDPTVNKYTWVTRYCYKCDARRHILMCDCCDNFWIHGYFKILGEGV